MQYFNVLKMVSNHIGQQQ